MMIKTVAAFKSLKNTQVGVLVAGGNPRKKESVDSELARGHVSKFYWLVALGVERGCL